MSRGFVMGGRPKELLEQAAFWVVLESEGRRGQRTQRTYALALLELNGVVSYGSSMPSVSRLLKKLSDCTRSTDFIGWYKSGDIVGVVFTEISFEKQSTALAALQSKISIALRGIEVPAKVSLASHTFPTPLGHAGLAGETRSIA